jgi:HAMP domain-containing protein
MVTALTLLIAMTLAPQGPAEPLQEAGRARATRTADPAAETAALRRAIEALTREMTALRDQMAASDLESSRKFQANAARLQLVMQDIERFKKERNELIERLTVAQARQDDATNRLANIQRELIQLGELNRSAAEDRIRATYNRQLFQAQEEINRLEAEIQRLEQRIERAEKVAETLRRRLKIDDSQAENP